MEHLKIRDEVELVAALASERFLLFKHSFRCSISNRAFKEYEEFLDSHPIPSGWIDVVVQRPLSLQIAELTGVAHQSPQALYIRDRKVVWNESHFKITTDSLESATKD